MIPSLFLAALAAAAPVPKDKPPTPWAEFRGPDGAGHYDGPPVPTEWGPDKNVAWKTKISGAGWSSPVVVNGKVYLTTAVPLETPGKKAPDRELRVLCLGAETGKIEWDVKVLLEAGGTAPNPHPKNSHASPTPVCDGERVYAHFGHLGTACLTMKGDVLWSTDKYAYKPVHGNGGSPILAGDKLVLSVDGSDAQFVLALDKKTGDQVWKTDRKSTAKKTFSFTTPQAVEAGGKTLIVSPASEFVAAYDATDGREVWRVKYPVPGYSVIPRPVVGHGLLFLSTGYDTPQVLAVDPTGTGDATADKLKWTNKKAAPHTPTPLLVGDDLYTVSDAGTLACTDAKTGTVYWDERLKGGAYSASPVLVNGKIYLTSETGAGAVVEPGRKGLAVLAESELKEKTFATPAVYDGGLYVRTETTLYKFAEKK